MSFARRERTSARRTEMHVAGIRRTGMGEDGWWVMRVGRTVMAVAREGTTSAPTRPAMVEDFPAFMTPTTPM